MEYGYKEVRKLGADNLRALCIKRYWYGLGNTEEYGRLLTMANKDNITTDDIVEMATDIMEHTPLPLDEFLDVCNAIAFKCYTYFEEA